MTPKEYQVQLLDAMESWRDESMAPDSPYQPQKYREMRKEYLNVNDAAAQQQAAAQPPSLWDNIKQGTSNALQSPAADAISGMPLFGMPLRMVRAFDEGDAGDAFYHNITGIPDYRRMESAVGDLVAGEEGAQAEYEALLPEFSKMRQEVAGATHPGIENITAAAQEGIPEAIIAGWQNPAALTNLIGSTFGRSPFSATLGTAGALGGSMIKPGGGTLAGLGLGSGIGGGIDERIGGTIRLLESEHGLDVSNPEHIAYLQAHPEIFDESESAANKRALAIGGISGLSGLVGGALGRAAFTPGLSALTRLGAGVASPVASGVLEAGGERLARHVGGQERDVGEERLEGLLGTLIDAPGTVVAATSGQRPGEITDMQRQLVEKEVYSIAEKLPYGGMVNVVQGERVYDEQGDLPGSAEYIGRVDGQGPNMNVHVDNLIRRSDGTRSGIRKQFIEDYFHEVGGHDWVQQQLVESEDFVQKAFQDNKDLILEWQKKSAYDHLQPKDHDILYEEWVSHFNEMNTRLMRRLELSIVNHLQRLIGKDATAKLIKSWDARNIEMRNIAKEYHKQIVERGRTGETQPVRTITAEEAAAMPRPLEEDFVPRESRGKIQDPSRRRFMKQTAGAVAGAAVDPSILLEPATPTPPEVPTGFGGGIMRPGVAPEMEGVLRAAAADTAPTAGLVSDVSGAFDDYDAPGAFEADQEAARQEREDTQRQLDELEAREAADREAETDAELYVETIDAIMSIYDSDATAAEAAVDGTLNDRIISYAAETPFTREELWDGVNQRIEELAEDTAEPRARSRESRQRKPKSETVQRDINEEKGKANKRIIASDIEETEKETRAKLLKRLQNVMGAKARKRGIDAGDQDVFQEQAAKIVEGDIEAVEAFIKPFEEQLTGGTETAYIADRRRALRAERIGKTDAEILKYRPKGAKHPMEGKMTYPFALEEIDRQEKAGEITAEEAEIRRLAVNNVRRIFKGKAGQTVKRTITEAVYGIGSYEDLVPWSEVYTEEQTTEMGERAEIGQAEARRTRYDPTEITDQQKKDLVEADVTAEEEVWIASDEMPELTTREERLLFLRSPTEFKSETEEKELNDFRAALKEQKPYDQKKEAEKREQEKEEVVSKAMAEGKYEQLPPEDITKLTYYQRSVVNLEPSDWERVRVRDDEDRDTAFQIYGEHFTEQGERIDDSNMDIIDPDGREPKRRESRARMVGPPTPIDSLNIISSIGKGKRADALGSIVGQFLNALHSGKITSKTQVQEYINKIKGSERFGTGNVPDAAELETQMMQSYTFMKKVTALAKKRGVPNWQIVRDRAVKDAADWLDKSASNIRDLENDGAIALGLSTRAFDSKDPTWRSALIPLEDTVKDGPTMSADHVIAFANKGLNFIFNMLPMPKSNNESLGSRSVLQLESQENITPKQQQALDYIKAISRIIGNREGKTDGQVLIDAGVAAGMWTETQIDKTKYDALGNLPSMGVIPDLDIFKDADGKPLGHLEIVSKLYRLSAEEAVLIDDVTTVADAMRASHNNNVARVKSRESKNKDKDATYTEHFNDGFWYTITAFLWGKPVQAIRDINKSARFGSKQGKITAADKIADLIQRSHSVTKRAEGLEGGTDMMQDISMRSGEFYTKLSRIFALATGRAGDIDAKANKQIVDHLMGKDVKFANKNVREAAEELKALLDSVYKYSKDATSDLETPLNLRGDADTLVPRVWNIEYIATRKGKAAFLKAANNVLRGKDISVTPEEMYETVINSGGFVQGDWTNLKADQTRTDRDIAHEQLIGETLDSIATAPMMEAGLVIDDIQALVPRFIQKAIERTEYSRRFGINDELLRDMIKEGTEQIRANNTEVLKLGENKDGLMHIDEKKFLRAVWDMAKILRNQYGYDMANMATRKWLQRATNTETVIKLPFVTLASIPEFFTPMLKGDVRPDKWFVDFLAGTAWAGYKGMNGMSKLLFNKHLPAMRKASQEIGGLGIISDVQLLRELGIADIQAMGDLVATRYANPNFARGGLRGGAKGTIAGKVPKKIRAVFNMQTYMQATLLTTITEMQQLMALRNFQRHMGRRVKFVNENKGKALKGRKARLMKQFTQDLGDYGIIGDIDLNTSAGQAEFNAGALRFVDQVITRPNDATTAKAFKNPLTAPLVLFKRFITTYGNTLMTSIGNDFATKTSNVERGKQVAQVASVAMVMYGSVMFAEIIRGALKGDLDEEDFKLIPNDFAQFMRRLDRTGLSSAPGAVAINLAFPYKRGWWDTTQSRIMNELLGPLGGDLSALGDALLSDKSDAWTRLASQMVPSAKPLIKKKARVKRRSKVGQGTIW